jgi:uncharacterized membrane protein YfcA
MHYILMVAAGLATGVLSGIFGIGGGVILVPILVLVLKFRQQTASGTSLVALLLPVGILGVRQYVKSGRISVEHVWFGLLIAVGIFVGTYFGARIAVHLPDAVVRRGFAVLLLALAVRMWFI